MADGWTVELARLRDALRAELFKVVRRRMTYICLAAFSALVVLFYVILWLRIREGPGTSPQTLLTWLAVRSAMSFANVVPYSLALERFFATLVCAIFAGTVMGNEFDWRTVGVVTGRGVRRWHFLFAKTVVSLVFTVVTLLLGLFIALAISAWFTSVYDLPWGDAGPERYIDAVLSMGRTLYTIFPFVFMALLFATLWRSGGLAVGAALGAFFIEGIFIGLLSAASGWPRLVPNFFLSINIDAVLRANGTFGGGDGNVPFALGEAGPPEWRGAMVLGAWSLAIVLVSFWVFLRRDIQE